jgi:hypothetical protein
MIAVAAQLGAVDCVRCLLMSGVKVGASEVEAAFRGGNLEVMRLLWDAFPRANPLELALEAMKSWNVACVRWLLKHKIGELSASDLVRLFEGACSSGSYSCGSSVLGLSETIASCLRSLSRVGVVGRVLLGGLAVLKSGRGISFSPGDSMASAYTQELSEWLPWVTEMRLVAKHEGADATSVNAVIEAAEGRARTLTVVETENGGSICGGYLDVPWAERCSVKDPDGMSFIFPLKNHLGVPPTKFAQVRDEQVAYMWYDHHFRFGQCEGFIVRQDDTCMTSGRTYEAPGDGVTLFNGDSGRYFRAGRWELWEVV